MYTAGYRLSVNKSWSFSGPKWRALFAEKVLKRGLWQRCYLWSDELLSSQPLTWSDTLRCGRNHQMKRFDILGPHEPKRTTSRTDLNVILRLRRKSCSFCYPEVNVHAHKCTIPVFKCTQPLGWWRTQAAYKMLNSRWRSCLCYRVISLRSFSKS